jgi:hypothetical protein
LGPPFAGVRIQPVTLTESRADDHGTASAHLSDSDSFQDFKPTAFVRAVRGGS